MGIVASKGDNKTPLLNLCKERKELIRAAKDSRNHLAKSHLNYFRSLLDFGNTLNQFVNNDLIVIPYSSDDDSSTSELICSGSDSDSDSDLKSDSDCLVCDRSQTVPFSNNEDQNPPKSVSGDETCSSRNNAQEEGLGFLEDKFMSVPIEDKMRGFETSSSFVNNDFLGRDIFGLYDFADNHHCVFIDSDHRDEIESDGFTEIREREGIPDLESEIDHYSLIRKNPKKKKKKKNVEESSSMAKVSGEIERRDIEENTCNGEVAGEAEIEKAPETVTEEVKLDKEDCDEAYESPSSSFSDSSCSGFTDLRNVVGKIKCICEEVMSNSLVSEFLEVSKVVENQPLGSKFHGFASRILGSSGNRKEKSMAKTGLVADNLAGSLSMTLEKLYMWEKKLYTEVTVEEKLRVSYDKGYKILKTLDQNGAEPSEIHEAETVVKLQLSKINVSVKALESISMRIHKIRDEELLLQVIEIINGFKEMWRFLAKCHRNQFRAIAKSKSCVHIVEKESSSRKATQKVEEQIRRYRESLRSYIDAQRGFVKVLNEWLNRNISEEDEAEVEAPEIFRVCGKWLREIENVDDINVLRVVEEIRLRFLGLGFKQVEEEKQRMRTERLSKELEKKMKEVEEIWGTAVVIPGNDSTPAAKMVVGPELCSLRESVTQEKEKHERLIIELNDDVSMSLQEGLVPFFEALEDFCLSNFKAYENIRRVSTETNLLLFQS